MKTSARTTFILLEAGTEDVALKNEISRLIVDLNIQSSRDFRKRYPVFQELYSALQDELNSQESKK